MSITFWRAYARPVSNKNGRFASYTAGHVRGSRTASLHRPVAKDPHNARDAPETPAFVPRYYKFESISLQR